MRLRRKHKSLLYTGTFPRKLTYRERRRLRCGDLWIDQGDNNQVWSVTEESRLLGRPTWDRVRNPFAL